MSTIKVAVLDTGIAKAIVDERIKLSKSIYYDYYDEEIKIKDSVDDYNGHGTCCINTIKAINPDVDFYSIDIMGISGNTSNRVLLAALEYVEKLDVDIISVSASSSSELLQDELKEVCQRITNSGKVILAAVENGKEESSIANFDSVIGVIGNWFDDCQYSFSKDRKIQMSCDATPYILTGKYGLLADFMGNSRATAVAAGIVSKMMSDYRKKGKDIIQLLEENRFASREEEYSIINHDMNKTPFDDETENELLEEDSNYTRFIFLLCEFFKCNDPNLIRKENLIKYKSQMMLENIHGFISLINERFNKEISTLCVADLVWAYTFYQRYIRDEG